MNLLRSFLSLAATLALAALSQASSFTVTSVSGSGANNVAQGTSNGVEWELSKTYIAWSVLDDSSMRFTGGNFSPELPNTDLVHIFGTDFKLTFNQKISSITFFLRENGGTSTLDFGLVPTVLSGNLTVTGTKVRGTVQGGVVKFSGLDTNELIHKAPVLDGMDAAWLVESKVPDSGSTMALLIGAIVLCVGFRRFRR